MTRRVLTVPDGVRAATGQSDHQQGADRPLIWQVSLTLPAVARYVPGAAGSMPHSGFRCKVCFWTGHSMSDALKLCNFIVAKCAGS